VRRPPIGPSQSNVLINIDEAQRRWLEPTSRNLGEPTRLWERILPRPPQLRLRSSSPQSLDSMRTESVLMRHRRRDNMAASTCVYAFRRRCGSPSILLHPSGTWRGLRTDSADPS
jgi:hypothetical protein